MPTAPNPDFFFRWLYALLALLPPPVETPALLIGPVVILGFLILLPFVDGEGKKSWKRRPIAMITIALTAVALGTLTHLATHPGAGHGCVEWRSGLSTIRRAARRANGKVQQIHPVW